MSKLTIKDLESFLLSTQLEDLFSKMPPKSENVSYLRLLSRLTKRAGSPEDFLALADEFLANKKFSNQLRKKVKAFRLLTLLEQNKDNAEKSKELLEELNKDFLKYNFAFRKPKQVETNNLNLKNFGEDEQKQKEERHLLKHHIDAFENLRKELTVERIKAVDTMAFFKDYDLAKVELKDLKKTIFVELTHKILEAPLPFFMGLRQFLKNFAELDQQRIQWAKGQFISGLNAVPRDWLEDYVDLPYWRGNEEFLKIYITKKFEVKCSTLHKQSKTVLENVLTFVETLDAKFIRMKKGIRFMLLRRRLEDEDFDKEAFKKYLEDPLFEKTARDQRRFVYKTHNSNRNSQKTRLKIKAYKSLLSADLGQGHGDVLDTYLKYFFSQGDTVCAWSAYFEEKYLKKMFFTESLLRGELPEGFEETLSESEVRSLTERKTLTLSKKNKKRFGLGEKVELELDLKNIQTLRVKIFQINIENALLDNSKVDFAKMDLLGLVARDELSFSFERPPLQQWTEVFKFDSIDTVDRGVFIIDFITGRLSSRAVIHKGSLALVFQQRKLGSLAWILDEQRRVCSGTRTGVYVSKKFYSANNKGEIHIPYNVSVPSNEVIACHDNFAVLSTLEVSSPKIELSLQLILNSEQLRAGNQVEFLLLPDLTLFQRPMPLSQLKDSRLVVNIRGELGNHKKIELSAKDLDLKDGKFFKVPVVFLPKTISIEFRLICKVGLLGTDEREISANKNISFQGTESRPLQQAYITRQDDKSFQVQVRGRNGEPRKNQEFSLKVNSTGLNVHENRSGVLSVSDKGLKSIGDMQGVKSINVNCISARTQSRKWLRDQRTEYSQTTLMVEGESLEIPVFHPEKLLLFSLLHDPKKQKFIEGESEMLILDNLSNDSSIVAKTGGKMVTIKNLKAGGYMALLPGEFLDEFSPVFFRVMKGERFSLGGRDFIEWNDQYVQVCNRTAYHLICNETTETGTEFKVISGGLRIGTPPKFEEDKSQVVKTEDTQTKNMEGVLVCYNFLNHENMELPSVNSGGEHHKMLEANFIKSHVDNGYYSNKMLDEEIIYVLQRKGLNEFMGNTLDKPSMLLKRSKLQATVMENLKLQKEKDFAQRNAGSARQKRLRGRQMSKKKINMNTIDLSYDFLEKPGKIITGIKFDAEGRAEIPDEQIENFNYVQLIANLDGEVFLTQTVKESWKEPLKQDLRLEQMKKPGYVYRNIRAVRPLKSDSQSEIGNVENTEFWTVSSLSEMMKAQAVLSPGFSSGLKEWEFLAKWNEMKPSDKLKKYDKFYSHELNIFVYFKDREFFDEVVAPFIANKKDKSPVDLFLLGRETEAARYLQTTKTGELNNLEMVLLLALFHGRTEAKAVVTRFKDITALSYNKPGVPLFKRLFENLLNSKKNADSSKPQSGQVNVANQLTNLAPRRVLAQTIQRPQMNRISNRMDRAPRRYKPKKHRREARQMMQHERAASIGDFDDDMDGLNDSVTEFHMEEEFQIQNDQFQKAGAKVYQPLESTSEYVEKTYYYRESVHFTNNAFYAALAEHMMANDGDASGFLNQNFIYCTASMPELIFVLSVSDLPFKAAGLEQTLEKNKLSLQTKGNCFLFVKEISEAEGKPADVDFLVSQRFYDPEDRFYHLEDGSKMEKPVKEFVQGRIYGCRVVATNSTVSDQSVSIITEIPEGAIALKPSDSLKVHPIQVNSFMSSVIDLSFYFPGPGTFNMYPATVAKEDSIFATAKSFGQVLVKAKKETIVLESISDVLSTGKMSDILDFLRSRNLRDTNVFSFQNIGWLMKDKSFYAQVLDILRNKGLFIENAWRFAVFHNDLPALTELLESKNAQSPLKALQFFENSLISIDRNQTKDYFPLINPRAHSIKAKGANIMNRQFRDTYKGFLVYLAEKGTLTTEDSILWVTYLLLQDRVYEAKQMFLSLTPEQHLQAQTRIQRDYIEAYIDFIIGFPEFKRAKAICEEYLDYPVLGWRNLFVEIANQLSEYEESDLNTEENDPTKLKSKKQHADKSPHLAAEMNNGEIKVSFRNQKRVSIEFYQIDVEVLFTQDPFETTLNSSLTNVLPFLRENHPLTFKSDFQVQNFKVPPALASQNLLLRVIDDSKQAVLLKYIPFKLEPVLNQQYGILKLLDLETHRPVPKVYVKCFAKMPRGDIRFFKDGYTDLRGSFDFASMNTSGGATVLKFRLLVASKQYGAKILEASPPVSSLRVEGKAKKIRSKAYRNVRAKGGKKKMKYNLSDYSMDEEE